MKYAIIVNPTAGDFVKQELGHVILKQLQNKIAERKSEAPRVFTVSEGEDISILTQEIISGGAEKIIVLGGDGTVSVVANGILISGQDIGLGIVPLGTANDFARNLGIKNWKSGISAAIGGKEKLVDVGKINQKYFLNSIGIGLDANIIKEIHKLRKKLRFWKIPLYPLYGFSFSKKWTEAKSFSFWISGGKTDYALWIAVLNGPGYGMVLNLVPQAKMDDGQLDFCILKRKKIFDLLRILMRLRLTAGIESFQEKELVLSIPKEINIHVDGEAYQKETDTYHISVIPGGLKVMVPKL